MVHSKRVIFSLFASVIITLGLTACNDTGFSGAENASGQFDVTPTSADTHPNLPPSSDSSTPPVVTDDGTPSPSPSVLPSATPTETPTVKPSGTPSGTPSPKATGCADKDKTSGDKSNGTVTPATVDSLVTKYGCVDPSDEAKDSNDKKILICHIPPGNPKAAHSICVAVPGAINGHGIDPKTCLSPVGDYCGACRPATR